MSVVALLYVGGERVWDTVEGQWDLALPALQGTLPGLVLHRRVRVPGRVPHPMVPPEELWPSWFISGVEAPPTQVTRWVEIRRWTTGQPTFIALRHVEDSVRSGGTLTWVRNWARGWEKNQAGKERSRNTNNNGNVAGKESQVWRRADNWGRVA